MTQTLSPVSLAAQPFAARGTHQAVLFIERRRADQVRQFPHGLWWEIANARVVDLLAQWLGEADAAWAATAIPEELSAAIAQMELHRPVISYNGQLKLSPQSRSGQSGDQPLCILVNARHFPFCDLEEAIALHRQGRSDATFFDVCEVRAARSYDERLRVGRDGQVERVDRVYDAGPAIGSPWPALVILSHSAAQSIAAGGLPSRMMEWPAALLRQGLRVHSARLGGRCFDLEEESDLCELGETLLRLRPQWLIAAGDLQERAPRVWTGKNVSIPASAELIGPLAIGDGAVIGEHAILVGPAAIGRNSRIGARVVVRRAIIPPSSSVISDSTRVQRNGQTHATARLNGNAPERLIRLQTVLEARRLTPLHALRHQAYLAAKRAMDAMGALVFLGMTLPFYPLIALAIKLNSPGPIFYGHIRQGRAGKNFRCWKFRTMIVNAEQLKETLLAKNEVDGPQFKIKDDPRIFFVGKWLRRLNMDEWPQFINVLLGQMSLVGPRPSPERENQMCPAWREARLSVRPGITGLWQVSRQRGGETDFQEWIYYDVQYVKQQSLWLDLKVLFKTIRVALRGS